MFIQGANHTQLMVKCNFTWTCLPWNWNYICIVDHSVTQEIFATAKKCPEKCGLILSTVLCNSMRTGYLLSCGRHTKWKTYTAPCHCTESSLISFSTNNSMFFCFHCNLHPSQMSHIHFKRCSLLNPTAQSFLSITPHKSLHSQKSQEVKYLCPMAFHPTKEEQG